MLFRSELIECQPIADHVLDAVIIEIRCIAAAVGAGQHVIISTQPRRDVGLDEPRIAERDAELVVDQLGLDRRRDAITELMRIGLLARAIVVAAADVERALEILGHVERTSGLEFEIGGASCRARVCQYVEIAWIARAYKKKNNNKSH